MSQYSKPQVTIDLDEYNDLIAKSKPKGDDEVRSAKTAIAIMFRYVSRPDVLERELNNRGLRVYIQTNHLSEPDADHVTIGIIKKQP